MPDDAKGCSSCGPKKNSMVSEYLAHHPPQGVHPPDCSLLCVVHGVHRVAGGALLKQPRQEALLLLFLSHHVSQLRDDATIACSPLARYYTVIVSWSILLSLDNDIDQTDTILTIIEVTFFLRSMTRTDQLCAR